MINYVIEKYKDGSIPNSVTIGVRVLDIPEYETAAFIFEDARLVMDEGQVGIESTLVFCDTKDKKFSIGKMEPETEAFMETLLAQIGTDMFSLTAAERE